MPAHGSLPVPALLWLLLPLVLLLAVRLYRARLKLRALETEAREDPLTGLPNRRGLAVRWNAMAGEKALILIDLVGFKAVNDSYGHIVGDALLRQVARRLADTVPEPGVLARWGGDEFIAVIPAGRVEAQQALIASARMMAYDLSASSGPAEVRIGARTGISGPETDLAIAVGAAARNLLETKEMQAA